MAEVQLFQGDCLDVMTQFPNGSVDAIFADLPYGTTRNKWDSIIPLQPLWNEYLRVCSGPIILTAQAPFDKILWASQPDFFRHQWIWEKTLATGALECKSSTNEGA